MARPASTNSAPSSSHPGVPHPTRSEVSTQRTECPGDRHAGPEEALVLAHPAGRCQIERQLPGTGGLPHLGGHLEHGAHDQSPPATHGAAPADSANTAHAPSMTQPERRTAPAAARPVTPRAVRTWNSITAPC